MSARENKTIRPCEDLREKAPMDPSNDLASNDKDDKAIVERHDPSDGTDPMTVEEMVQKCEGNKSKNNLRPASTTFAACTLYLHAVREESTSAVGREGGEGKEEGNVEGGELTSSDDTGEGEGGGELGVKDSHPCDNVLLFFKFYDPTVEDMEERVKLVHVQVRELHERATLTYVHIQFSETSYVHSIMKFFTRPAEIHRAEI